MSTKKIKKSGQLLWAFTNTEKGQFESLNLQISPNAYFPLFNFAGIMSCVTPELKGDTKTGQNSFLTPPIVSEELPHTRYSRNFWIKSNETVWSATGCADDTKTNEKKNIEKSSVKAGILYFDLTRNHKKLGLIATTRCFVPFNNDTVEIIYFSVQNVSKSKKIAFTPFFAMPLYGRSADNQRDHRQVTTLLNRITTDKNGVYLKPTMVFDERGHHQNTITYAVTGCTGKGKAPDEVRFLMKDHIGKTGSLTHPEWIFDDISTSSSDSCDGLEAVGALKFKQITLKPGEKANYVVTAGIADSYSIAKQWIKKYGTIEKCTRIFKDTQEKWKELLDIVDFETGNKVFDNWIKWVSLQPHARKVFGCSFLPDFGYGRGGRGWRDLWQDCLSLLLTVPEEAKMILINNFAGVRLDGSNATIIGNGPGEFLADRNNLSRTFMDHGVWPLKTTSLYIEQTGDLRILLEKAPYFRDHHTLRGKKIDQSWDVSSGYKMKDHNGNIYKNTIFEHILIQHISSVLNVGEHNICRLENADWNDGHDMAPDKGESVPFTCFYASNLILLSKYCNDLHKNGIKTIKILKEFSLLLKELDVYKKLSWKQKNDLLQKYMLKASKSVSGKTVDIDLQYLASLLQNIGTSIHKHVDSQEWISLSPKTGFYNGYYNNDGEKTDGKGKKINISLTGQVFPMMCKTASKEKIPMIFSSIKKYLQDPKLKGIRLNSDYGGLQMNLGRAYAFAYGTKENGAFFSHMNVMLMNSLYKRNFVRFGFEILSSISDMCTDSSTSRIFPGLPEYFDLSGKGAYHYLTGSASWMILTLLTQVFGVRGEMGNLIIEPKLVKEQFSLNKGRCCCLCLFAGKKLNVTYHNSKKMDFGKYCITKTTLKGIPVDIIGSKIRIKRKDLLKIKSKSLNIDIYLG
ncbi:MAG: cellobiose phosphorylase [Candidatus Aureabacteria bacterium]|nr:cellobiose phosphorylase [Candidatus Auribacterota bacterium]